MLANVIDSMQKTIAKTSIRLACRKVKVQAMLNLLALSVPPITPAQSHADVDGGC